MIVMGRELYRPVIRVTTLIENKKGEHLGLQNEHGLSFLVEIDQKTILFDTGKSDAFIENASKLRRDLSKVDSIVLSHGHYDHTGGLKSFVSKYGNSFSLFVHPDIFIDKYRVENDFMQFLGNDWDMNWLRNHDIRCNFVKEDVMRLTSNTYLISNFSRVSEYEENNPLYRVKKGEDYVIDDFHDEVSMVLNTEKGLVVMLGCSHAGIENILRTVIDRLGDNIYLVIGGTHLVRASQERINNTIQFINKHNINYIGVSHCTGELASSEFLRAFGENYFYNSTGTVLEF